MKRLLCLLAALLPVSAAAQDLRDLCPARPGLGTPSCIVDKGHVLVEMGLGDWEHDQNGEARTDTVLAGDLLLRYGLDPMSEVQVGWTAFGHVRERDPSGGVRNSARTGDVSLAYKRSLVSPDGSGFSVAAQPYVTLPVGRSPIGAGDWGAGVVVPLAKDLSDGLQLQFSPEVDAAVDEDGDGRHLAYGLVGGLGIDLGLAASGALELSAFRDEDPGGHATALLAGASLAWQPGSDWQLDAGGAAGLNQDSADIRLYMGVARRF